MGHRIGAHDPKARVDRDDALREQIDEQVVVVTIRGELDFEPRVLVAKRGNGGHGIGGRGNAGDGTNMVSQMPGPDQDDDQAKREDSSNGDEDRLHGASIAQRGLPPRAGRVSPRTGA